MSINPVNKMLQAPGDVCRAGLAGDPQVILSLSGSFTGAVVAIEALPAGQVTGLNPDGTPAGPYIAVAEVRTDIGQVTSGQIGPINGGGLGSGLTLRADGGGIAGIQIRLISIGSGAVLGGIASVPFPYSSAITVVAGVVSIAPTGQLPAAQSIPVVQAVDSFATPRNPPLQPAGGEGPISPQPVRDAQLISAVMGTNELLRELIARFEVGL